MQKVLRLITLLSVFLVVTSTSLSAQSITYKLLGKYIINNNNPDTLQFKYRLGNGFDFCRWEFSIPIVQTVVVDKRYIFAHNSSSFTAKLWYTTTGGDCSLLDLNLTSKDFEVYPRLAHFIAGYDKNLDSLASLKRVLRSSQNIADNIFASIGNFRYFWDFDAKMIPAPEVNFDNTDLTKGQFPNVYYTFPNGGDYIISLKVIDITSPNDTAIHTKPIRLTPEFGADKINFEDIPNVFTPGGSTNNFFKVESSGTSLLSFKVFSRAGALVYQFQGNVIKWDGKNYYGQDLPEGIYYYVIEDISSEKKYNPAKGFFYIYR